MLNLDGIRPEDKSRLVLIGIVVFMVVVMSFLFSTKEDDEERVVEKGDVKENEIVFGTETSEFQKRAMTTLESTERKRESRMVELEHSQLEQKKKFENLMKQFTELQEAVKNTSGVEVKTKEGKKEEGKPDNIFSGAGSYPPVSEEYVKKDTSSKKATGAQVVVKDEKGKAIKPTVSNNVVVNTNPFFSQAKQEGKKNKKGKNIGLMPMMLPGKVVIGVNAKTKLASQNNPQPVVIILDEKGFLPNKIRASLEQCFVVASAWGTLDDGRIHMELANLTCVNEEKKSVVHGPIIGTVADAKESKHGVKGRIVSKMGDTIGKVALAEAVAAIGEALKLSTQTYEAGTGVSGARIYTDPKEVGTLAAGAGLGGAAENVGDMLKEYVALQSPVIELNPGHKVVVYLTKSASLSINEFCEERPNICDGF